MASITPNNNNNNNTNHNTSISNHNHNNTNTTPNTSSILSGSISANDLIRSPFTCPRHNNNKDNSNSSNISPLQQVSVTIDRTEHRVNHVVFLLQVRSECSLCGLSAWIISKRYSEFQELHKELTRELKELHNNNPNNNSKSSNDSNLLLSLLPSLPGKKYLGNAFDSEFIQSRRIGLESYINKLIQQQQFRNCKSLILFLSGPKPESDAITALFDQYIEMKSTCAMLANKFANLELKLKRVEFAAKATLQGSGVNNINGVGGWQGAQQEQILKDVKLLRRKVRLLEEVATSNGQVHLLKSNTNDNDNPNNTITNNNANKNNKNDDLNDDWNSSGVNVQLIGRSKSHQSALTGNNNKWNDDKSLYDRTFQPIGGGLGLGMNLLTTKTTSSSTNDNNTNNDIYRNNYPSDARTYNYEEDDDDENSNGSRLKIARAVSQRAAAREQRRSRRRDEEPNNNTNSNNGHSNNIDSDEERARSLSESHLTDRLAAKHFNYHTTLAYRHNPFVNTNDTNNNRSFSSVNTTSALAAALKQQRQQQTLNPISSITNNNSNDSNRATIRQHSEPIAAIVGNNANNHTSALYYKQIMEQKEQQLHAAATAVLNESDNTNAIHNNNDKSSTLSASSSSSSFASFGKPIERSPITGINKTNNSIIPTVLTLPATATNLSTPAIPIPNASSPNKDTSNSKPNNNLTNTSILNSTNPTNNTANTINDTAVTTPLTAALLQGIDNNNNHSSNININNNDLSQPPLVSTESIGSMTSELAELQNMQSSVSSLASDTNPLIPTGNTTNSNNNNTNPSTISPHGSQILSQSPITSAMAAISDSVANAVLSSSTPYSTPPNQISASVDNPALIESPNVSPKHSSKSNNAPTRRAFNVNRLPPPNLTSAAALAQAEVNATSNTNPNNLQQTNLVTSTLSSNKSVVNSTSFASIANNLGIGVTDISATKYNAHDVITHTNTINVSQQQQSIDVAQSQLSLSNNDSLFLTCLDNELVSRMNDLITFVQPTSSSEQRYLSVLAFIEQLIKRTISADTFCHGSFALKTYLPDADLDVSAFFSRSNEDVWVQRLVSALCNEAANPSNNGNNNKFAVKSVTFVNADCQVVKCQIGHVSVDISSNQIGALQTLALFEEIDVLIGQNHLFKRSILLVKTYFQNDLGIVGSHSGLLSAYCIRTFVLFIFNAYHDAIKTPLQGLYKLLVYLANFNWNEHAFGIFGPIKLATLPKFNAVNNAVTSWPNHITPLVTQQLLQTYSQLPTVNGTNNKRNNNNNNNNNNSNNQGGNGSGNVAGVDDNNSNTSLSSSNQRSFSPRYMNVIDPTNAYNNLGRSVSGMNASRITIAFKDGANRIAAALNQWKNRERLTLQDLKSISEANQTLIEDEELDLVTLQAEHDSNLSFTFISRLFERTLQTYSGRFAFSSRVNKSKSKKKSETQRASHALQILNDDGKLAITNDELINGKVINSATQSPSLPSVNPTSNNNNAINNLQPLSSSHSPGLSDSEVDTETDQPSASDFESDSHTNSRNTTRSNNLSNQSTGLLTVAAGVSVGSEPLDSNLSKILENLSIAKSFEIPTVSEEDLVVMINKLLLQYGSVPVGKLGSLLHNVMNNHSLPSMLKERYGGLKKFIERHLDKFIIGTDHPFNPNVHIATLYLQAQQQAQAILNAAAIQSGNTTNLIQPTPQQILAQVQAQFAINQARLKANNQPNISPNTNNSQPNLNTVNNTMSNNLSSVMNANTQSNMIITTPVRSNPAANTSLSFAVGAAEFIPQSSLRYNNNNNTNTNTNNPITSAPNKLASNTNNGIPNPSMPVRINNNNSNNNNNNPSGNNNAVNNPSSRVHYQQSQNTGYINNNGPTNNSPPNNHWNSFAQVVSHQNNVIPNTTNPNGNNNANNVGVVNRVNNPYAKLNQTNISITNNSHFLPPNTNTDQQQLQQQGYNPHYNNSNKSQPNAKPFLPNAKYQ